MNTAPWDRKPLHLLFNGRRGRWTWIIGGVILVALCLGVMWAARAPSGEEAASVGNDLWGQGSVMWAMLATVMVLGLLYGSLWAIRLFTQQGRWAREGADLVRLRTTIRLGNNQMLHVVQFGSQLLLVGSSQTGLALLGKMPASPPASPSPDFGQTLTEALEREED